LKFRPGRPAFFVIDDYQVKNNSQAPMGLLLLLLIYQVLVKQQPGPYTRSSPDEVNYNSRPTFNLKFVVLMGLLLLFF
jgi:hypothetical protein